MGVIVAAKSGRGNWKSSGDRLTRRALIWNRRPSRWPRVGPATD